jgi:UDP-N-acetylglucosamine acyltransferase
LAEKSQNRPPRITPLGIHPSAVIEKGAQIGEGVSIGPFCHIGAHVTLGDGVELISHVALGGNTSVGARTRIFPFASIGHEPQDLKFHGEDNSLTIGSDCMIREGVTMNPGTEGGGGKTIVGNHCTFLANSHIAHDVHCGHHVILSNNVMIAGHCSIGDYVIAGGGAAVHQFVRIGPHAFIAAMAAAENDVIPYGMAIGNRANLAGLNLVGLKRRGFERDEIHALRRAYRLLFAHEGTLKERVEDVAEEFSSHVQVMEILNFIRDGGDRPICTPREARDSTA